MKATETIVALRKLKVDCLYNKDTHFNAARRLQEEANRFRIFLIFGTIFASFSTIMNVGLWDKINYDTANIQVVVNLLGALGGFLILYTTTFSDHHSKLEQSTKHFSVGNSLNLLYKKIRKTEASFLDGLINDHQLLKYLDEFSADYFSICNTAPLTIMADFLKAKINFVNGYSTYTNEELSI